MAVRVDLCSDVIEPSFKKLCQRSLFVRERGKGNWYAVLSVRDPQTGKRKVQWRSLPDCNGKREAQQECARIVTEMRGGGYAGGSQLTSSVHNVDVKGLAMT